MSEINLYPEMNQTIKDLLKLSEEPMKMYILARIEQLEQENDELRADMGNPVADPKLVEIDHVKNADTGNLQDGKPLTLNELRGMDGEPVWVEDSTSRFSWYAILCEKLKGFIWMYHSHGKTRLPLSDYGKTWLAYRHKPEKDGAKT